MLTPSPNPEQKLPWWTWVLPLLILHGASELSAWSRVSLGTSLFYFTSPLALVMIHWWGLRVLPAVFINVVISNGLFGLANLIHFPLYAIPETTFVFLSWLFFVRWGKGKCWLPNIYHASLFLVTGLSVPLVIYKFIQAYVFQYTGTVPENMFWPMLVSISLSDFILIFAIAFPAFYFFSGPMLRARLTWFTEAIPDRVTPLMNKLASTWFRVEIIILLAGVLALSRTTPFSDYWFIYGILSLYAAIRFGFGIVILFNSYILILTYFLPSAIDQNFTEHMFVGEELNQIQLGMGLLYVFSTVTGRVMSDSGGLRKRLIQNNEMLEQANRELDRFVYSVSHDLSAPLRSIMGLVNVSRLEKDDGALRLYINNIETSVHKLENFINEILDYSRNERQAVTPEEVDVEDLCREILDNLKFQENFNKIDIDLSGINSRIVFTDKMRLKMILNNLLSNAVKFQQTIAEHQPSIHVRTHQTADFYFIDVEDNGEGIPVKIKDNIFDMFFRGTQRSKGSGLGLYIAKEAAEKINGKLTVESEYGKGSVFHLELKKYDAQK